jgi:phosphoglycolate phosphatase-like HAD superfamily hydrolase
VLGTLVVDVDDTLLDTTARMQAIWGELLGRVVPREAVESKDLRQLFTEYATGDQLREAEAYQRRFFRLLLCEEDKGLEFAELDTPIPGAAEALRTLADRHRIVYLTGRTENTRAQTLESLRRHGFPVDAAELLMVTTMDWHSGKANEARKRLLEKAAAGGDVSMVVDDYPGYFPLYVELGIPERVGLLKPGKYKPESYIERGATRVIEAWGELL